MLRHFLDEDAELSLILAQLHKFMDIAEDEFFDVVHHFPVVINQIVILLRFIHLPREYHTVEVHDQVVAEFVGALLLIHLRLLKPQIILLNIPMERRVHFCDRLAPRKRETQHHVVHILVEGIIHVVVEVFLRNQLKYFLVMLPILHFALEKLILCEVWLVFDQVDAGCDDFEDEHYDWKSIKSHLRGRILTNIQQIFHEEIRLVLVIEVLIGFFVDFVNSLQKVKRTEKAKNSAIYLILHVDEVFPWSQTITKPNRFGNVFLKETVTIQLRRAILLAADDLLLHINLYLQSLQSMVRQVHRQSISH